MRILTMAVAVLGLAGCAAMPWGEPQVVDFSEDRVQIVASMGGGDVPEWVRAGAREKAAAVCETEYKRYTGDSYERAVCHQADPLMGCLQGEWTAVFPCREKE